MCTLTWFVKDNGYELFFNRDEHTSRKRADLPTVQQRNKVAFISPTDTDAGGTWISSNQFGVTVCLLNHYQFEQIATYKSWISRGEIVKKFATIANLHAAQQYFEQLELHDYRAFRMFVIDCLGNNRLFVWDGHKARTEVDVSSPKSSSSVDASNVKKARKLLFNRLGLEGSKSSDDFLKYHVGHLPDKSQNSVCMHRDDANTVSLSYVAVDSTAVKFSYTDGQPCQSVLQVPLMIERTDSAGSKPKFSRLA